jgi:hypothetical protein
VAAGATRISAELTPELAQAVAGISEEPPQADVVASRDGRAVATGAG